MSMYYTHAHASTSMQGDALQEIHESRRTNRFGPALGALDIAAQQVVVGFATRDHAGLAVLDEHYGRAYLPVVVARHRAAIGTRAEHAHDIVQVGMLQAAIEQLQNRGEQTELPAPETSETPEEE